MIGIVGASGAVGRHAVALLAGGPALRVGARRTDTVHAPAGAERVAVDATDPASLDTFCRGLALVINCAGPSYLLKDTVATAALAHGADYVDVGGDDPAHEALAAAGTVRDGRTAVLSAGTVPGLSVLLPRWLAAGALTDGLDAPRRMAGYAGGLERCSPTVAADILLSLTVGGAGGEAFGHPLAAWRDGARCARALRVLDDAELAHYPEPVTLQPLLTAEVERVAVLLGVRDAEWYSVYPGAQVRSLFGRLPTLPVATEAQRETVERRMVTASEIDLSGRDTYYRMVVELGGDGWTRVAAVRAASSYRITAAVAVHAARAVLAGVVPSGLHFAGDVLDPTTVIEDLHRDGVAAVSRHDGALAVEEGVL